MEMNFEKAAELVEAIKAEVHKRIVGQEEFVELTLVALVANGHILIEGVPGLAKTFLVRTLSEVLNLEFKRIQFTPDMLPSDIIGGLMYNQKSGEFTAQKGPVFTNMVLADEINRAPAKVQSALLEAMQEREVTIGGNTYPLPKPFLVMATQNPIEQEGTYPLPEAQVDRFLVKAVVTYPSFEEEVEIINRVAFGRNIPVKKVCSGDEILAVKELLSKVEVKRDIKEYVVRLVDATRNPEKYGLEFLKEYIKWGASVRASIAMIEVASAFALIEGRDFVLPDDVKRAALPVLRHRVVPTFLAEAEGKNADWIVENILRTVKSA